MEKQIPLFPAEANHDHEIWISLPDEAQLEIENIFAQILVENLLPPLEKE
ncbi:MAG: hypothetical protein PHS17_12600 [Desulfobacterales bacterium]|nr:hypothetical protein [Desulfobacterales bacterium]